MCDVCCVSEFILHYVDFFHMFSYVVHDLNSFVLSKKSWDEKLRSHLMARVLGVFQNVFPVLINLGMVFPIVKKMRKKFEDGILNPTKKNN